MPNPIENCDSCDKAVHPANLKSVGVYDDSFKEVVYWDMCSVCEMKAVEKNQEDQEEEKKREKGYREV